MSKIKLTFIATSLMSLFSVGLSANSVSFEALDQAVAKQNRSEQEVYADYIKYVDQRLDEYEVWRANYTKQLDAKRAELIALWGSAELDDKTKEVTYSHDNTVRQAVDYETDTVEISVLVDADTPQAQAKKLLQQQAVLPDGTQLSTANAVLENRTVDYSLQQQQKEKAFIVSQTQQQMNEYDIQAERLISANIGVEDSIIYQRAYRKKMALIADAKQRIDALNQQFEYQRQQLGITPVVVESSSQTEPEITAVVGAATPTVEKKAEATTNPANNSALATDVTPQAKSPDSSKTTAKVHPTPPKPVATEAASVAAKSPKKVVSYKIKLPNTSLAKRAKNYQPLAIKESQNWSMDPALIMAIMHSESSFRPKAKSHVPAFGLMQVVPTSAGHDVNRQVRKIDAPMKEADLYQPEINVETGTAYLHILDTKYLKSITDETSRMYCIIAAYNTGAGNVARAFNQDNSTNIRKAAKVINQMTPDEVYQQLLRNLPYQETKNYLKKVSSRIDLYQVEAI